MSFIGKTLGRLLGGEGEPESHGVLDVEVDGDCIMEPPTGMTVSLVPGGTVAKLLPHGLFVVAAEQEKKSCLMGGIFSVVVRPMDYDDCVSVVLAGTMLDDGFFAAVLDELGSKRADMVIRYRDVMGDEFVAGLKDVRLLESRRACGLDLRVSAFSGTVLKAESTLHLKARSFEPFRVVPRDADASQGKSGDGNVDCAGTGEDPHHEAAAVPQPADGRPRRRARRR